VTCGVLQIFTTPGTLTLNRLRVMNKGVISGNNNFAGETDNKPCAKTSKTSLLTAELTNEQWFNGRRTRPRIRQITAVPT